MVERRWHCNFIFAWGIVAVCVFALTPVARGQQPTASRDPDSFLNQQRAVVEQTRRAIQQQADQPLSGHFDWGGWYSGFFFLFDDGLESSRTLRRHDLRIWGRASFEGGAHQFNLRLRLGFLDFNAGDSFDGNDNDVEGPNLERGIYRFDLAKARNAQGLAPTRYNLILHAGRDLVQLGTGLALSTPLDHVAVSLVDDWVALTGFIGRTVGSAADIDISRRAKRTRRAFFGGQVKLRKFQRHEPFAYALWQTDHNSEPFPHPLQEYEYDSFYLGLGSTGELARHLRYGTELVFQGGTSYGDRRFLKDNKIRAWAFDAQLEYLFPGPRKARTSVEYVFASGDSDRLGSPSGSIGGNRNDFTDTGFSAFGYRDTGLAFAPRLGNLHMLRMGASYYPWPNRERYRQLQLGTDWFFYHKHHRTGAVSDPTANRGSGFLGWEMDFYANWRLSVDLSWTTRFGVFFPGDSFSDRSARTFLLMGVTWSF